MTPGSVIYGPPSWGQQTGTGNCARSTSLLRITVSWHGGRPPTVLGGNFATSASRGSRASLPNRPSGTLRSSSSAMRPPISSRLATPRARAIRRSEPNRFTATGWGDGAPPTSVGCWNTSAGPPPGDFMQRSAISVISLSTETGRSTRASSPVRSIAPTNARRLSSAIMDSADATAQQLVTDIGEPSVLEPPREGVRVGEFAHRLWQVGIGVSMFRHRATDGREHPSEIPEVRGAQRREARRRELEHHEAGAGAEHPVRLAEPRVQVREVPHPERDHRAVEAAIDEGQHERVGGNGTGARRLALPPLEHRHHEVRADHAAREARLMRQRRREVQGARAEIEIDTVRSSLPAEPPHRGPAPAAVQVEAEEMIEKIVARRDSGEHTTHIGPLRVTARTHSHLARRRRGGGGGRHRRER